MPPIIDRIPDISNIFFRCGYDSLSYGFQYGTIDLVFPLTKEECFMAHNKKQFVFASGKVLKTNGPGTYHASWYSAGGR